MRICIDSCVFIRGLRYGPTDAGRLLDLISPALQLVIPRLVAVEVSRNLTLAGDVAKFYHLFHQRPFARIIDEPVPVDIVQHYVGLGLRDKGDAIIGAFTQWQAASCLISDNRHFLRELRTDAYRLLSPEDFLNLLQSVDTP